jgi:SAM-dependent methyltransferase
MSDADKYGEYFGARAPSAVGSRVLTLWHRRMFEIAARTVPALRRGGRILEIGAGHGFFAGICRARGLDYTGIEMNGRQAQRLREDGFEVVTATVPPLPSGEPADCVWMSHVLEHARDHVEAREMLSCTRTRSKPGGCVVITSPDLQSWRSEFWSADWSHGYPTTLRRVCQLVSDVGMEIAEARTLVATLTNPVAVALVSLATGTIPYRLLDAVSLPLGGRDIGYSFMGTFGWKQIQVIGRWR